jgi:hypothetical protein
MMLEHWWNGINRENPNSQSKNASQCHFVHHKHSRLTWDGIPDLRGERPATNRLSHGTASHSPLSGWSG